MNSDRKIDAEKIHIVNIKTLKGNIEYGSEADVEKIEGHLYGFDLKTALNLKLNFIGLKLQTDIIAIDKYDNELPVTGSYTHEMLFNVENLSDFIVDNDKGLSVDAALGSTLTSIIYSTVRGLVYSRTQGTSLGTVILPVIAPLRLMGIEDKIGDRNNRSEDHTGKQKGKSESNDDDHQIVSKKRSKKS